jgi:hypothetical protein
MNLQERILLSQLVANYSGNLIISAVKKTLLASGNNNLDPEPIIDGIMIEDSLVQHMMEFNELLEGILTTAKNDGKMSAMRTTLN